MTRKDKQADQTLVDTTLVPPATASFSGHDQRRQAEAFLVEKKTVSLETIAAMTPTAIQELIHELQVHQIELALQNEELRRAQVELSAAQDRYFNLYDQAPLGFLTVNDHGDILEANHTAATLLGTARGLLIGLPLSRFINAAFQDRWYLCQRQLLETRQLQSCDLLMTRADRTPLWARLQATPAVDLDTSACQLTLADVTAARLAEEALRQSEERFRKVLAEVPSVAVQGYQVDGTTLYWNLASARLYGYSPEEAIGRNLLDLIIPPELRPTVEQAIRQMAATGEPIPPAEVLLMRKDGSRVAVFSSHAIIQVSGQRQELFCIDIDLTAARQAEEQLRQQAASLALAHAQMDNEKKLLAAVMAALPIGLAITDAKGGTLQTNQAFERIWGGIGPKTSSVADYTAYHAFWADTNEPVSPEQWASAIAVQQGESTVGQVMRLQCFDGTETYVLNSASPVYNHLGQIIGSAVALQDITELKRVEQELLRKEEDFVRAQEVGKVGSWRLDVRRNLLTWSEENYRIFGVAPGTVLCYETFLAIVHPDDRAMVDDRWQAALAGADYDIEHRLVVDDQVKWVREKAYLEFDRNGALIGGFGITQDISKHKQAEELIKRQLEKLQASNEDLEKFNQAAVGRELRMIELKEEINHLCALCNQPPRYRLDGHDHNGENGENGDHGQ